MRRTFGMVDPRYFIRVAMTRLVLKARGPARSLATAVADQFPHLMTLGMPAEVALRETLQNAVHAARELDIALEAKDTPSMISLLCVLTWRHKQDI